MNENPRNDDDHDVEYDPHALANAAADPSLRHGSFWADAMRDLALEGSSSEERLQRRARNARAHEREEWTVADPAVELPRFDKPAEPGMIELPPLGAPRAAVEPNVIALSGFEPGVSENVRTIAAEKTESRRNDGDASPKSVRTREVAREAKRSPKPAFNWRAALRDPNVREYVDRRTYLLGAAFAETILFLPCGVFALYYLNKAFKSFALENYNAAHWYETRARRSLRIGKWLILSAFIVGAAVLTIVTLLNHAGR